VYDEYVRPPHNRKQFIQLVGSMVESKSKENSNSTVFVVWTKSPS